MSLAEELQADFDDDDGIEEENEEDMATITGMEMDGGKGGDDDDLEEIGVDGVLPADIDPKSVFAVSRLKSSKHFTETLEKMSHFESLPVRQSLIGPVENDPEYQLIVQANHLAVTIENEVNIIHKYIRDAYTARFPELENLIVAPFDYIRTVKQLKNSIEKSQKASAELSQFLPQATLMIISVTASTTQGKPLDNASMNRILEGCDLAIELKEIKERIEAYVESRMNIVSPNLCAILGSATAAKVMAQAGGLTNLSRMPSCNIGLLGAVKRTLGGFSTAVLKNNAGYISQSDFVQKLPPDFRAKAAKLLANKAILAARIDQQHECPEGVAGREFLAQIQKAIDKLQEPPPVKNVKALPAPIDKRRKRRGGRRHRKMKERLGLTDLRRDATRTNFGEIEDDLYQDDLGVSVGALGKNASSGRVRGPIVDSKTKTRISKTLQQKINRQNHAAGGGMSTVKRDLSAHGTNTVIIGAAGRSAQAGAGSVVSGTQTSVIYTPVKGFEISMKPGLQSVVPGTKTSLSGIQSNASSMRGQPIQPEFKKPDYFSSTSAFKKTK